MQGDMESPQSQIPEAQAIRKLPTKPIKPDSKGVRSYVRQMEERIYVLQDQVEVICVVNDRGEPCDRDMESVLDPDILSEGRDEDDKLIKFPTISGRYGWAITVDDLEDDEKVEDFQWGSYPVPAWYPGNFAVMLRPLTERHNRLYYAAENETFQQTLENILAVQMHNNEYARQWAVYFEEEKSAAEDAKPEPPSIGVLAPDEFGLIYLPGGIGTIKGTKEYAMTRLVAHLLSFHGRLVPDDNRKGYALEPVTVDEVEEHLPLDFARRMFDPGQTTFDEVMRISTLFDFDKALNDLKKDGELTPQDDDLGNSPAPSETRSSAKRRPNPRKPKPA